MFWGSLDLSFSPPTLILANVGASLLQVREKLCCHLLPWRVYGHSSFNHLSTPCQMQGEVLFFTCERAAPQQMPVLSRRLHVPKEKKLAVSNALHLLLDKSPGLHMHVSGQLTDFQCLSIPVQSNEHASYGRITQCQ